MPIPAAKSSENHAPTENSGLSSSRPSLMSPKRENPITSANATKKAAIST
jgi:hypothetical protein